MIMKKKNEGISSHFFHRIVQEHWLPEVSLRKLENIFMAYSAYLLFLNKHFFCLKIFLLMMIECKNKAIRESHMM